jgi:hypothetical protein
MTLDEFVEAPPCREVDNDQTRRIAGLEPALGKCTQSMLDRATDNLRRYFTVAGVMERFDETLILMNRRLGWRKDILYWRKNSNADRPAIDSLPRSTRNAILHWNELDCELYRIANQMLDDMISSQDENFSDELKQLTLREQSFLRHAPTAPATSAKGKDEGTGGPVTPGDK